MELIHFSLLRMRKNWNREKSQESFSSGRQKVSYKVECVVTLLHLEESHLAQHLRFAKSCIYFPDPFVDKIPFDSIVS